MATSVGSGACRKLTSRCHALVTGLERVRTVEMGMIVTTVRPGPGEGVGVRPVAISATRADPAAAAAPL